ncbi:MAG: hypothetical protein ACR2IV_18335 [Bryobacteraceae bacterium]
MRFFLIFFLLTSNGVFCADIAVTNKTTYNVGEDVLVRLPSGTSATASIRYAGENRPAVTDIPITGADYRRLWKVHGRRGPGVTKWT